MDPQDAIDLSREAIRTCISVGSPILIASLLIGLVVSLLQSMTQLHDQAIGFVPKILLVLVTIAVCLPWLSEKMIDFTKYSFEKPVVFQAPSNQIFDEDRSEQADSKFVFQWSSDAGSVSLPATAVKTARSSATSMPTFRPTPSTSQPQLRPQLQQFQPIPNPQPNLKLQPRLASPFSLPAYRSADSEAPEAPTDAPTTQTKTF